MPNWFIGLPAPVGPWSFSLTQGAPKSARLIQPRDLHLTISFLGAVEEKEALEAWKIIQREPPEIYLLRFQSLKTLGRRPDRFGAVAMMASSPELEGWMARVGPAAQRAAGVPVEGRKPRPHVTLLRPQRRASAAERWEIRGWMEAQALDLPLTFDRAALYTWAEPQRLGRGRRRPPTGAHSYRIVREQSASRSQ